MVASALLLVLLAGGCPRDDGSAEGGRAAVRASESAADRLAFVTHYQQGLELARGFQARRALVEFESCLAIRADDPDARLHRGRMLLKVGPKSEGVKELERLAAEKPEMLAVQSLLRSVFGPSGAAPDPSRAASARQSVESLCGRLGEFDLDLGNWLAAGTGPSPVQLLVRGSWRHKPRSPDTPLGRVAHAGSRRYDIGPPPTDPLRDRNRNAESQRAFAKLFDDYPALAAILSEHAAWLLNSQVRFQFAPDPSRPPMSSSITLDLAQQYYERALDASAIDSPAARVALLGLGDVARDMGDFEQAIQHYTLLLEQSGLSKRHQVQSLFNLGLVYYKTGKLQKSRPLLESCFALQRNPVVAWLHTLVIGRGMPLRPEPVTDAHRATLRFSDQAAALGVDKLDGAGPSAWCDTDLDGDLDLFVCGCDTFCILYRNDGDVFTDVSRQAGLEDVASGFSATFADYDNDGDCDLYIGRNGWSGPAPNSLYRNRGDGSFEDVTREAGVAEPGSSFVHGWSDFDRDGHLDLFIASGITRDGSTNVLYHNNSDGTFTDITARAGLSEKPGTRTIGFAIGDYDRDGWPDIFVNSYVSGNRLYHNRGDGTFEEVAASAGVDGQDHPWSGYVAFLEDFDNDAWPDILLTKLAPFPLVLQGMLSAFEPNPESDKFCTKLYHNNGDGTFTDVSAESGLIYPHGTMGANVADVNNDGFLDFYLGTGDPAMSRLEPNAFYANQGDGRFVDLTRFTRLGHLGKGHGITFVDYDFDGDLDIYAPQGGFMHGDLWNNAFYRNELGNTNHWLSVQLEGTKSNRMGVGTTLTLRAGDLTVYREMKAGGAFGSSSSPYVHFGLGRRNTIDSLAVTWPSGKSSRYVEVPVNRFIRIVESAAAIAVLDPPRFGDVSN